MKFIKVRICIKIRSLVTKNIVFRYDYLNQIKKKKMQDYSLIALHFRFKEGNVNVSRRLAWEKICVRSFERSNKNYYSN